MTRITLGRAEGAASATGRGWGPTSRAGAGLDLFAVRKPTYGLAIRLELGYVAAAPVNLVATPAPTSDDTLQLDMSTSSLGGLNLSGPEFAVSLVSEL